MESDPATYAEIGDFSVDMIVEINAKTLTRQTLAKNGEDEPDDEETESDVETGPESEAGGETKPEAEGFEGGLAYG